MEAAILVGIQAAGKSTFYRERFFAWHVRISLDLLRTRHRERSLLAWCLGHGQRFVVDNTNVTTEQDWLSSLIVASLNDLVTASQDEDYGALWSRRVFLASGHEVEFGFTRPTWAATEPLDAGTRAVVRGGCRALYDPHSIIERLIPAVHQHGEHSKP